MTMVSHPPLGTDLCFLTLAFLYVTVRTRSVVTHGSSRADGPHERGETMRKVLYTRAVQRLAVLFLTIGALGAPRKW